MIRNNFRPLGALHDTPRSESFGHLDHFLRRETSYRLGLRIQITCRNKQLVIATRHGFLQERSALDPSDKFILIP